MAARFLELIQPPDLEALGAQGAFVYCYLRSDDLTPYYVGIAGESNPERPIQPHNVVIPEDRRRIRILKSGLSWEEACEWEERFISHYGRKDNNTGILRDMTDGGEGTPGRIVTDEVRESISSALTGRVISDEWRDRISKSKTGHKMSEEFRAAVAERQRGKALPDIAYERVREVWTGRHHTAETCQKMSAAKRSKAIEAAQTYGVDSDWYLTLNRKQRQRLMARWRRGVRGEQLIANLLTPEESSG